VIRPNRRTFAVRSATLTVLKPGGRPGRAARRREDAAMPNSVVHGTDIATGEQHSIVIEGVNRAHAEVLALKRGLRVDSVEPDQLCPGDESRLAAINFVDPTEPLNAPAIDALELDDQPFTLPAWFTVRRCRQARLFGALLLVGGLAAYFAHTPHEGY